MFRSLVSIFLSSFEALHGKIVGQLDSTSRKGGSS
jgi:hypothetical protein